MQFIQGDIWLKVFKMAILKILIFLVVSNYFPGSSLLNDKKKPFSKSSKIFSYKK